MNRLPKRLQRVAPPAVPEIYRHSGSSFGSAGYGSCDDTANMGGGSNNFYATANDPNNSLNVSLRSNASNSSIDLPDSGTSRLLQANPAANVSGKILNSVFWSTFFELVSVVFCSFFLNFMLLSNFKNIKKPFHFDKIVQSFNLKFFIFKYPKHFKYSKHF